MVTIRRNVHFVSIERCTRETGLSRYQMLKLVAQSDIRRLQINQQLMVHLADVRKALEAARQHGEPVCTSDDRPVADVR